MRFATSNIKNNPDLSRPHVRDDMRTVRRVTRAGLIVWQEIGEVEDHRDLELALPDRHWDHRGDRVENAVSVLRSVWSVEHEEVLRTHGGRAKVSPSRNATILVVRRRGSKLRPFAVIGTHTVSGAFTDPGQLGDADGWRRAMWDQHIAKLGARIEELRRDGISCLVGGDWNRNRFEAPFGGDRWLARHGLDGILWADAPRGVRITRTAQGVVPTARLYTDHAAVWIRGTLHNG